MIASTGSVSCQLVILNSDQVFYSSIDCLSVWYLHLYEVELSSEPQGSKAWPGKHIRESQPLAVLPISPSSLDKNAAVWVRTCAYTVHYSRRRRLIPASVWSVAHLSKAFWSCKRIKSQMPSKNKIWLKACPFFFQSFTFQSARKIFSRTTRSNLGLYKIDCLLILCNSYCFLKSLITKLYQFSFKPSEELQMHRSKILNIFHKI